MRFGEFTYETNKGDGRKFTSDADGTGDWVSGESAENLAWKAAIVVNLLLEDKEGVI